MAHTPDNLTEFVFVTVAELTQSNREEVNSKDRLREDLGLDSLQSMELLSRVSEEFEIDPEMDEVMSLATVGEIVSALTGYLEAAS